MKLGQGRFRLDMSSSSSPSLFLPSAYIEQYKIKNLTLYLIKTLHVSWG